MRVSVLRRLCSLRRTSLAGRLLPLENKQVGDRHLEHSGKFFKPGYRRCVHAPLDKADELHRAADFFCQFRLRQPLRLAQTGDPLAKFLQKHGWEITTRVRCWQRSQTTGGRGQFLDVGLKCTISPLYQPPPVPSARRGQHGWYLTANINKKGQQEKPQAC